MGIDYQNSELALKVQCHDIFNFSDFLHESVSPEPLSIPLGPFRKFPNFAVAAQGAPPVLLTLVSNGKNLRSEKF
jgi:hypothetical protein